MQRRELFKILGKVGIMAACPWPTQVFSQDVWQGLVFVNMKCSGGVYQGAWGDPRTQGDINHYSDVGIAGNLAYAPLSENDAFFQKYYDRMLIINGIDVLTGSHKIATRVQQTGRKSEGYPALSALYGACVGSHLPLPVLLMSGGLGSGGLISPSRLGDISLEGLATSNLNRIAPRNDVHEFFIRRSDHDIVKRYQIKRLTTQLARSNLLPRERLMLQRSLDARINSALFDALAEALPANGFDYENQRGTDGVKNQIHKLLVAFKSGVSVSGSVKVQGQWDTHGAHDKSMAKLLPGKTQVLDYLWDKAEEVGIADRLVVHVTSDVGRGPGYNSREGKNHWSNTSSTIMMKNQSWTNRVVGVSGPRYEKLLIDPITLQPSSSGIALRSPHVHRALRRILGIDRQPLVLEREFEDLEMDLLNPNYSSPLNVNG